MKFSELVKQAVALLQDSERLTYRALKREFDLDDETLADLTYELIEGREVAADKDGKVLAWTGGETSSMEAPSPPAQRPQPAAPMQLLSGSDNMLDLLEKQKIEILRVIFIDLKKDTKCDLL